MKSILALLLIIQLHAADLTKEFMQMSDNQVASLILAYNQGGYNLAAIAWQESNAGKYRINMNPTSVDLGLFHLNNVAFLSRWYVEHPKKVQTHFYDNILLSKIMTDDSYASIYAQKELDYWNKKRHRNTRDSIKSYNCGTNIERRRCDRYLSKVMHKRSILIKHLQVDDYVYRSSYEARTY